MGFYISKLKKHEDLEIIHKCYYYKSEYEINDGSYKHGEAINNEIYYNSFNDNFLVSNGEYCSIIEFCPWCGVFLKRLLNN